MGDSNNHLAGRLPAEPYPELRQLDPLVGRWRVSGDFFNGEVSFGWMEGGYFLVQHVDARAGGRSIRGIEYIGFDEETRTLRSHYMDVHGSNFTYTWAVEGDTIRIWFGDQDSDNFYVGHLDPSGNSASGEWKWPGGGYSATMTRIP